MSGFLIDLHCHTREHSDDATLSARDLVVGTRRAGLHGLVLTDHAYLWPEAELHELARETALPPEFLLLSGQEIRVEHEGIGLGDLLIYGVPVGLSDGSSVVEVFRLVREHDGFVIAPHPVAPRIGFGPHLDEFPVAAVEVWNGRRGRRQAVAARRLARERALPEVGGSDAHHPGEVGSGATWFPEPVRTMPGLAAAVLSGAGRPWVPKTATGLDFLARFLSR